MVLCLLFSILWIHFIILDTICNLENGNQINNFDYIESTTLKNTLPVSGTLPVTKRIPRVYCANFCIRRKKCQMFFHENVGMHCLLYDSLIWNETPTKVSNGFRAYRLLNDGRAKCRNNDVWNRGGNICFRQYNSSSMITSGEAKNRCNVLQSDLLVIDTIQKKMFFENYYRGTNSLPALVGLSDKSFEGIWIWDNGVLFNYFHWGLFGVEFNGVDITRPGVFCLNADCGWIGVYKDIFMVWDNCCSKTSHWICFYSPWTFWTYFRKELFAPSYGDWIINKL